MHRILRTFASKPKESEPKPTTSRKNDNSVLSKLPYEVLENILTYAWHGQFTGLPGGGEFIFDDPRQMLSNEYEAPATNEITDDTIREILGEPTGPKPRLPPLQPAPHTRLTSSANWAGTNGTGVFLGTETYVHLSLVCSTWHEIMLDLAKEYVSLPTLKKFHEYATLLEVDVSRDEVLLRVKDQRDGKEKRSATDGQESPARVSKSAEKARRLCRSLHIDIPTGNLSMVPSWNDIPTIIQPLSSLTHLLLTASEPHPALLSLLANLPQTITTLDIHISSPFAYKPLVMGSAAAPMNTSATIAQTQAEMARRERGRKHLESLRLGVENVKHVLINVIDPVLLGSLLEGFGSMEPAAPPESSESGAKKHVDRDSTGIYASRALQTVTLQGTHDLTCREITHTISHSSTIHTLKLYPHTNRVQPALHADSLQWWNAVQALENEAWFPALEKLVVQLPNGYLEKSPELERIQQACDKRSVVVDVQRLS